MHLENSKTSVRYLPKKKGLKFFDLFLQNKQYFFSSKKRIFFLLITIFLSTLIGLLLPWPFALLVDSFSAAPTDPSYLYKVAQGLLPGQGMDRVLILALSFLGLKILHEMMLALKSIINTSIDQSITAKVRSEFFAKLQSLHLDHHKKFPRGETLYRLNNDTLGYQQLFNMFVSLMVASVILIIMGTIMYQTNSTLTFAALPIVPLLIMLNRFTEFKLEKSSSEAKQEEGQYVNFIQQALSAIGLSQLFVQETREYQVFQEGNYSSLRSWFKVHRQLSVYRWGVGIIYGIATCLIIYFGGKLALDQSSVSMGELSIFMMYLGSVYDPLCTLTGAKAQIKTGLIGIQRVQDILQLESKIQDSPIATALPLAPRDIHFRDVKFSYNETSVALEKINVTIPKNSLVVIVGESGAGKSTLLHFFPRFYDPTEGGMYLDDYNVKDLQVKTVRSHVAMVLQDVVLLPTTVAENISYGRPQATRDEIITAATFSGAHDFIMGLPQQYDTPLAQDAHILSGGQKQRIAIARSLVTRAPILVFDEPTSALDTKNERLFNQTLEKLKGTRTLVIVTHRLSCAPLADKIIVLKKGEVVAEGTHDELLKDNPHYQEIAQHQ